MKVETMTAAQARAFEAGMRAGYRAAGVTAAEQLRDLRRTTEGLRLGVALQAAVEEVLRHHPPT